ncbi:DcrB-related protein [Citrobacter farmeri]|nr:DcrB-related protein [Citrobacter farmeri]
MAQYILPEGSITLPVDDDVQDVSVTLLRFPLRGTSLTISRAPLSAGQNVRDIYQQQLEQVRKKQKHFVIREQRETSAGVDGCVSGTEILCQYAHNDSTMCQYQFAGQCGQWITVFCYSRLGDFTRDDIAHWRSVLDSFTLAENSQEG